MAFIQKFIIQLLKILKNLIKNTFKNKRKIYKKFLKNKVIRKFIKYQNVIKMVNLKITNRKLITDNLYNLVIKNCHILIEQKVKTHLCIKNQFHLKIHQIRNPNKNPKGIF